MGGITPDNIHSVLNIGALRVTKISEITLAANIN